jgi:hypothetical protein
VTKLAHHRALVVSPARGCGDLAGEARLLREEAQSRYSEVDLLVAAMRDHIRDLQAERDRLLAELDAIRARTALEATPWLWRGMKPAR